jgi:HlyD family secretion protein
MPTPARSRPFLVLASGLALAVAGCRSEAPADRTRVSGQIEATDVQVAGQVGGRLVELNVSEGARVEAATVVARLDTADARLGLQRAEAEEDHAEAQLRLLEAGPRVQEVRQADAQARSAQAERAAAETELRAAQADVDRFEALLASNAGSRKQRDDAVTRRDVARQRVESAEERTRAAREALDRIKAGARREEIDGARARVQAARAQVATWQKAIADAEVVAPVSGIVTEKLADVGELLPPRAPLVVITDLDRAWANVYVDEPVVPRIRLGQRATIFTDAGGEGIPGTVSFIAMRAEFTPRNVQTAEDRSKLVYRVKIAADNQDGVLKVGMPVEAEIPFERE